MKTIPIVLYGFQTCLREQRITSLDEVPPPPSGRYERFLVAVADAVGRISAVKSSRTPMLGSKIMHFLLPEFFPVWDTAVVKNKALRREWKSIQQLGDWLPDVVKGRLSARAHGAPALEYAQYVAMMLKDLWNTPPREYEALERTMIRTAKAKKETIDFHYYDLAPTLFEVCLVGKHLRQ